MKKSAAVYDVKRMVCYGITLVAGIALVAASSFETIDNFWSGFGGGIAGVSLARLVLGMRYRKDEEYSRQVDIYYKDERTLFLSAKAKSWAFYLSVLGLCIAGIVLRIIDFASYSQACFFTVCGMMLIYCAVYWILKRRY